MTCHTAGASVVALNDAKVGEPCVEVRKMRSVDERGELVFDRWCYVHHHWLNGAPAQDIVAKMVEDCNEWNRTHRSDEPRVAKCDCCDQRPGVRKVTGPGGIETWACEECIG